LSGYFDSGISVALERDKKDKKVLNKKEKKMKKAVLTIMALTITAIIATSVLAFGPGRGPGYGPCGRGDFGQFGDLNLTAEQKTKLTELKDARFKEIKPLQEQMFTKRDDLRKLWLEPNPDQAKITAAQKEMRTIRDQMQDKMTAFRLESLKVLTPEQKEKAKSYASGYRDGRGFGPGCGFGMSRGFGPGSCGSGACQGGGCQGGGPGPGGWGRW
jgi:Spy/CpxP family protein refolding chaperone